MKKFLRQSVLKQMKGHKRYFLLNQWCNDSIKNKTSNVIYAGKETLKQTKLLYDGDQRNKRTTNKMQGVNALKT